MMMIIMMMIVMGRSHTITPLKKGIKKNILQAPNTSWSREMMRSRAEGEKVECKFNL